MSETELRAEREAVIAAIEAAFDGVRLDGGVTLHEARATDDYEPEEVRQAARLKDTEDRWQDVTDDKLRELSDTPVFLCPKGYKFYLPAFLRWVLRHLDDPDSEHSGLSWSAIYSLDPDRSTPARAARFEALDDRQRRAVCRFLRHLARRPEGDGDADDYLDRYWGRYCQS